MCRTHLTTGHCDYGSGRTHRRCILNRCSHSRDPHPLVSPACCCVQRELSVCARRDGAAQPRIRLQVQNRSEAVNLNHQPKYGRKTHPCSSACVLVQSCVRTTIFSVRSRVSSPADANSFVSALENDSSLAVPAAQCEASVSSRSFAGLCSDDEYRLRASEFEFWLVSPAGSLAWSELAGCAPV